ncbi:MAG: hypothetical protein QNJ36_16825 [Calothrix sp. MO_167.B42]|nr:hypothetical protein [Calothrix sp. MO_167.B42]
MKHKTITYQRVLNLGNYENKKLEITAELDDGEDIYKASTELKKTTETIIRSELVTEIEENVKRLKKEQKELITQNLNLRDDVRELQDKVKEYEKKLGISDDLGDDVPFDQGSGIPRPATAKPKIYDSNDNVEAF